MPVRVRLANLDGALRPNAYAQIQFFDPTTAKVALPASAVMSDGATELRLRQGAQTASSSGATSPSARRARGKVPVLAGLELGDQVVVQGAILLDNQIQLDN